jgi:hypothetical protein
MTLEYLKEYCEDYCEKFPSAKDQIMGFYDLALMEVEDGANEDHECELAVGDINAFINGEL